MGDGQGRSVRYGLEAAAALLAEISRAKAVEPLAPVTVVVVSNQVGLSVRRLLASGRLGPVCGAGPGLIGVTFATPYRLAELLGASALARQGRRPVSMPVLAAGVRAVLTAEPGVFAPVAAHPATEAALVSSYRELRDLTEASLVALETRGRRAAEVVRVFRTTRARLEAEWYDEEDLMAAATIEAISGTGPDALGSVVVYLPQRLSRHAAELLRAIGSTDRLTVLAGCTGVDRADAEVHRSVELLDVVLGPSPETGPPLAGIVSPTNTRIITTSDADDEVRAAVRTVVDAVRSGTSLDRIAVLHASPEPYARLLHDHLWAAGVATNGAAEVPLAGRLAGRVLLGLLQLPATGYRRQDVFAWITGAPITYEGRLAPTTSWERVSRTAGVVGGRSSWDDALRRSAERHESLADDVKARPDEPQWRAMRALDDAERARSLRGFVLGLIDDLAAASAAAPWSERARWAKALLDDLLGGPARRLRWPEVERRAAERVELALDRLAALDDVEGPVDLDVFTRTLAVELESDLGRIGRFGEGILVGPASLGVGVDLDLLVLVGMAEGTFPATAGDDSLLPDEDRQHTDGGLALRSGQVDRLHHQFLATMSGAVSQVLCVPKGDLRRSRERVPSRWVLDVASELAGERWWTEELLNSQADWLTHVESFDAGLRTAQPATAQEHRLRHILSVAPTRRELGRVVAPFDDVLAAGVSVLDARRSDAFTRFDGNLAGQAVPSPVDRGTSATRLEGWARCPHSYLMATVLRVEPLEQPEVALQISPLDRGNLVHEVFEEFLLGVLATGPLPEPAEPWSIDHHQTMAKLAAAACGRYELLGLTGREIFWRRDRRRILGDVDRFLYEDDRYRALSGSRPVAAEMPFGIRGAAPVLVDLGDGRALPLRGQADRVDRAADGTLLVLDYKTGKADPFKSLDAADPHQGGRRLQLAVYGQAARQLLGPADAPVRADYWFTSAKAGFGRHGYQVTDAVLAEVTTAMATIVTSIEAGLFPPHPGPPSTSPYVDCHFCDPDGLGTSELLALWLRKRDDPALAAYLALVDPAEANEGEQ